MTLDWVHQYTGWNRCHSPDGQMQTYIGYSVERCPPPVNWSPSFRYGVVYGNLNRRESIYSW